MTTVTIGIAFRDDARTLPLAIRSVFAQDLEDWELLLVDDGSTDGSLETARAVADPRVRVLSDGFNKGLPERLNEIGRDAAGAYVARMDADDVMVPDRLSKQVAHMVANQRVQVLATRAYVLDATNVVRGLYKEQPLPNRRAGCLANGIITHPTVMTRTAWSLANPYDPQFRKGQDKELWCRTFTTETFDKLSTSLLFYRTIGNVSFQKYQQTRYYDRLVLRKYAEGLVGKRKALQLIVGTAMKQAVFASLAVAHREAYLSQRRCIPLPTDRLAGAQHVVARISATPVPGLDPAP